MDIRKMGTPLTLNFVPNTEQYTIQEEVVFVMLISFLFVFSKVSSTVSGQ